MDSILQSCLGISVIVFMVGSLLSVGLKLKLGDAIGPLRNLRFVELSLLWAFVLSPALAVLLTRVIPLAEPYGVGLIFLGMAPCAPFLPAMTEKAGGDLGYTAAFMLLTAVVTVMFMPLATPFIVQGFKANTWTIARPLLIYIICPLLTGLLVRCCSDGLAEMVLPIVRRATTVDTLILLGLIVWIYGGEFVQAVGTFAIGAQLLFCATTVACGYLLTPGLHHSERSVVALGICTRNIGAAFAPLVAAPETDRRVTVMIALAVPITMACAALAASILARLANGRTDSTHLVRPAR